MSYPKVYADFHNADLKGRLRLNCVGTMEDLSRLHIKLSDGQPLTLYSEELEVDGVVQYSDEESLWVALIDWDAIREVEEAVTYLHA
ncbi:hypothetical protein [Merismopedia glauca]|uniref:Uncharacterized protein n=1 Tax=Merismopedia glauca CCAP 1448/3 TaxID=1296344 RepID=A0A2T1C1H2_9CYAN|nr:hypothetical protein [Merismopedia glauca]PSB02018.1 hypothetical protein C7B64_15345 [Merismopedia glauca CCAP 1448/3]